MSKPIDKKILICPTCKSEDLLISGEIVCRKCDAKYSVDDKKYIFMEYGSDDVKDSLDRIKFIFKKLNKLYNLLIYFISPVYHSHKPKRFIKNFYKDNSNSILLNLGSGNYDISDNMSNVDIFAYDSVDLVCDIANLPIMDNAVDFILNLAVLEHVPDTEKVVEEFRRILKPGGTIYVFFPFIQPFHASPFDFSRRTFEGMKILFKDFKIIKLKPAGGPTSGLLWVIQEWIAIVLSFGNKKLHLVLSMLLMILTFPVKFLDFLFIHHPLAKNISSGFVLIGKKV
jgi:SAM-dependent methyltransferase